MSRTRGWASATLFSALALGCAKPAHVPAEYAGDVPLTIVNDATGPVCDLIMIDPTRVNKENWIGSRGLEPGKSLEFRVRPAIYIAKVRGCQHWLNTPDTELYTGGHQESRSTVRR